MSIQEQHRYSASLAPGRIIRSGFSADSGSRTHAHWGDWPHTAPSQGAGADRSGYGGDTPAQPVGRHITNAGLPVLRSGGHCDDTMTGSRCGICNGDAWYLAEPSEVDRGQVPKAVLKRVSTFYRCGICSQVFWPSKGSKAAASATTRACADWRPSSQLIMALGTNSKGAGGAMLREAKGLHSTLQGLLHPEAQAVARATYYY